MVAKTVMVMGTGSSAGKSLLTAAICRCLSRRGLKVAPFKAQNMSNNAAVCESGGEIGRSQFLQAIAANATPQCDMNPVLLKPEGETRSQVIVNGRATQTLEANDYFQRRQQLWPHVAAALDRLRSQFDVIVIEGAGSPVELNLADVEMVNLAIARYAGSPVLLIGDIERGGVFAQLLGTLWLLEPADRELIQGLIVNKFRGDLSLFDSGVQILQDRGGVPVLGVLPWIGNLHLPEEDAVALDTIASSTDQSPDSTVKSIDIAVIHFPHIANFDDFDPLDHTAGVTLRYVRSAGELGTPDVVILPGTKNTLGDAAWLMESGIGGQVCELQKRGVRIIGICGGYQMLGHHIDNPDGLESDLTSTDGLGLLETNTVFRASKQTRQCTYTVTDDRIAPGTRGQRVSGYEIHCGQTSTQSAWLRRESKSSCIETDGSFGAGGRVWGCYLHGLFHNDGFRTAWLRSLGWTPCASPGDSPDASSHERLQTSLDRLADSFESHIDMEQLERIIFNTSRSLQSETQHVR
jgi:adenosylcobyric acid synthase